MKKVGLITLLVLACGASLFAVDAPSVLATEPVERRPVVMAFADAVVAVHSWDDFFSIYELFEQNTLQPTLARLQESADKLPETMKALLGCICLLRIRYQVLTESLGYTPQADVAGIDEWWDAIVGADRSNPRIGYAAIGAFRLLMGHLKNETDLPSAYFKRLLSGELYTGISWLPRQQEPVSSAIEIEIVPEELEEERVARIVGPIKERSEKLRESTSWANFFTAFNNLEKKYLMPVLKGEVFIGKVEKQALLRKIVFEVKSSFDRLMSEIGAGEWNESEVTSMWDFLDIEAEKNRSQTSLMAVSIVALIRYLQNSKKHPGYVLAKYAKYLVRDVANEEKKRAGELCPLATKHAAVKKLCASLGDAYNKSISLSMRFQAAKNWDEWLSLWTEACGDNCNDISELNLMASVASFRRLFFPAGTTIYSNKFFLNTSVSLGAVLRVIHMVETSARSYCPQQRTRRNFVQLINFLRSHAEGENVAIPVFEVSPGCLEEDGADTFGLLDNRQRSFTGPRLGAGWGRNGMQFVTATNYLGHLDLERQRIRNQRRLQTILRMLARSLAPAEPHE